MHAFFETNLSWSHGLELVAPWIASVDLKDFHYQLTSVLLPRDDAFSDSLSQKADSEASSGPLLDDKASSKNDLQSPTEHISDYGFGGVMGR